MSNLSTALQLADLDDFIAPSQSCVKPVELAKTEDAEGSYVVIRGADDKQLGGTKATITLHDCLACSGCITSAESLLITSQSVDEFLLQVSDRKKHVVVSISPQSRASVAAKFGFSIEEAHRKLDALFRTVGAEFVFDTTWSRNISLYEIVDEFLKRYRDGNKLPLLASACPGWICYAEKAHPEILDCISRTRSPQAVMGSLVKRYLAKKMGIPANSIYHVTVMPCFDKKLEAARDDFRYEETREVDCVLGTSEILTLLENKNLSWDELKYEPSDSKLFSVVAPSGKLLGICGGGSGGYLEFIFRKAAKAIYGVENTKVEYEQGRNSDLREVKLTVDGKTVLHFAAAYGFRNIQNIVRKISRGKCSYHFVEIMACPAGCLNGGGQIRPDSGTPQMLLGKMNDLYNNVELVDPEEFSEAFQLWSSCDEKTREEMFRTNYHSLEAVDNPSTLKW